MMTGWERLSKIRGHKQAVFHGGEPLLLPLDKMEELCRRLTEKGCTTFGIQTSTYGMTDERIDLFKKYKFGVGVSFDGPWYDGCPKCASNLEPYKKGDKVLCPTCSKEVEVEELDLNRGRGWISAPAAQREFATKTIYWIDKMHEKGLIPGTITVLNSFNASTDSKLQALMKFYKDRPWLSGRFNPVHTEQPGLKFLELDEDRLVSVYLQLAKEAIDNRLAWYPIRDAIEQVSGISNNACWHGSYCDATNTVGSTFVNDNGDTTVCPKLASVFDVPLQIDSTHEPMPWRPDMLKQTPFESGGCKGCKWWSICHGGCESDGLNGDIRNRTRFCKYLYALWDYTEWRIKNIYPAFQSFADYTFEEQEKRAKLLAGWSNENYTQFKEIVRLENRNEKKNPAWEIKRKEYIQPVWNVSP
jgi:uncharacterized protein